MGYGSGEGHGAGPTSPVSVARVYPAGGTIEFSVADLRVRGARGFDAAGGDRVNAAATDAIRRSGRVTATLDQARALRDELDRAIRQREQVGW